MGIYYKVKSFYFDDGKDRKIMSKIEAFTKPNSRKHTTESFDCYIDYFDDEKSAKAFMEDGDNENRDIFRE